MAAKDFYNLCAELNFIFIDFGYLQQNSDKLPEFLECVKNAVFNIRDYYKNNSVELSMFSTRVRELVDSWNLFVNLLSEEQKKEKATRTFDMGIRLENVRLKNLQIISAYEDFCKENTL